MNEHRLHVGPRSAAASAGLGANSSALSAPVEGIAFTNDVSDFVQKVYCLYP